MASSTSDLLYSSIGAGCVAASLERLRAFGGYAQFYHGFSAYSSFLQLNVLASCLMTRSIHVCWSSEV